MNVHHVCTQIAEYGKCMSNSVRNILQLEVQENMLALFLQEADNFAAYCIIKLHANLVVAYCVTQFDNASLSLLQGRKVECDY